MAKRTVAIIPARGGSKRLPNKNLSLIGGKTLVEHSINYAMGNAGIIDDVVVSSDSKEIIQVAKNTGATVVERPAELSGDESSTISVLKHTLLKLGKKYDVIVLLQPTNPLRPPNLLKDAFKEFENGKYDSLMTVSRSYHKLGKIEEGKFIPFNYKMGQRSQDLEPLYYENGLLYIIRSEIVMNNLLLAEKNLPFKVNHLFANVDIDTIEDLRYAQFLYENDRLKNDDL
ncbi:acylneuraminate cytidylyltransferase family protein [Salinimicrobium flavum]|uniref:Cytidylyltransferase domain-containing protein n=1 Tax=Salinimicrobium flavum TaxID=1737065 RepID=A0ABW5IWZ9_9FLAO